jgi:sulfite reductase (ferredoxin)
MTLDPQKIRIEGIYAQKQQGFYMQRAKVPAGALSVEQAMKVCEIAERFARGSIHLTSRCSIEFHWLREEDLPESTRMLQAVGLTSRGACGGAVRGITSSTSFAARYPVVQVLARKLHQHFTQNPHFEGLPKKFKIGVDAGYAGSRHLIQDIGLVLVTDDGQEARYDVWIAGGLGREPQPGFLLAEGATEGELIPIIEAAVRIYKERTPLGKRLKHLVRELGQEQFRQILNERITPGLSLPINDAFPKQLTQAVSSPDAILTAGIFAGELEASVLRRLTAIAAEYAGSFLILTADQNIAFHLRDSSNYDAAKKALAAAGFDGTTREERVVFRVCPGSHECRMGLVPTRDMAREVIAAMGPTGERLTWAISGCHNSCSQPQLADVGIMTVSLPKDEDGERRPRFDFYRRDDATSFGRLLLQDQSLTDLLQAVADVR